MYVHAFAYEASQFKKKTTYFVDILFFSYRYFIELVNKIHRINFINTGIS